MNVFVFIQRREFLRIYYIFIQKIRIKKPLSPFVNLTNWKKIDSNLFRMKKTQIFDVFIFFPAFFWGSFFVVPQLNSFSVYFFIGNSHRKELFFCQEFSNIFLSTFIIWIYVFKKMHKVILSFLSYVPHFTWKYIM